MMSERLNIDRLAAEYSQEMVTSAGDAKILERLITKTLGVLQEQGVYAMMLFLFSRSGEEKVAFNILPKFYILLTKLPVFKDNADLNEIITIIKDNSRDKKRDSEMVLKFYSSKEVMEDIDTLFLIRDLYEQTLIYARYGAKAAKKEE
jgi:hypothetical protein